MLMNTIYQFSLANVNFCFDEVNMTFAITGNIYMLPEQIMLENLLSLK
jgi:hypothetical protein